MTNIPRHTDYATPIDFVRAWRECAQGNATSDDHQGIKCLRTEITELGQRLQDLVSDHQRYEIVGQLATEQVQSFIHCQAPVPEINQCFELFFSRQWLKDHSLPLRLLDKGEEPMAVSPIARDEIRRGMTVIRRPISCSRCSNTANSNLCLRVLVAGVWVDWGNLGRYITPGSLVNRHLEIIPPVSCLECLLSFDECVMPLPRRFQSEEALQVIGQMAQQLRVKPLSLIASICVLNRLFPIYRWPPVESGPLAYFQSLIEEAP